MKSLAMDSPVGIGLAAATTAVSAYILYRRLLPKPIPGIPCNPEAVGSLLGDLPAMIRESAETSGAEWIVAQASRHPGPLCQIFLQPLGKPFLILSDYHEAQDVFLRRSSEWDRSDWSIEILGGVAPSHHINMKTGPAWKAHRRLLQDLMTPAFLHTVAAPNIYNSVLGLVQLWDIKEAASGGRPFSALDDIYDAALDAVLDFSFGTAFPHRAIVPQLEKLQNAGQDTPRKVHDTTGDGGVVVFPHAQVHETLRATLKVSTSVGEVLDFPRPSWGWYWKKFVPSEHVANHIRHTYAREQIEAGVRRLEARSEDDVGGEDWVKSAVDLMLDRETKFAAKEGRAPVYWSPTMRDEVRNPASFCLSVRN